MKRRRQFTALRSTALEFCLLTGLHGCKYIAQPGKHGVERFFWLLAVGVSVLASAYCMVWAYDFNRAHQTLLAIDTTHYPLWAVAAPAVTVCPSNKVLASRARRLARAM
ncbi:uncharacterized protein LOC127751647 [Frankliniella occidentalis]|uniref:Uncharacterized protein LOC127751647 n=1 Tax=Frankliniella occidentalis TaxID=133901 RepID=A0A9C6XUD2_FRAOC|nr:uncharacterized protein LOC127751647 [Frankliniella occidentalis]